MNHEKSPWAEPESVKPPTIEEVYADGLGDYADVDDMRMLVRSQSQPSEPAEAIFKPREIRVGDTFLVKRSNGVIESAPVGLGKEGELILEVTRSDGQPGSRQLTEALQNPDMQRQLAAEHDQQAIANEARDEIDNMKFYPSAPIKVIASQPTHLPSASVDAPLPTHEPYYPDKLDNPVRVRSIDPHPPQPIKKRWWQ
jgi:hypothetical protein